MISLRPCVFCFEEGHLTIRDTDNVLIATHHHKFLSKEECSNWCKQVVIPALQAGKSLKREHWKCTRAVNNEVWQPSLVSTNRPLF